MRRPIRAIALVLVICACRPVGTEAQDAEPVDTPDSVASIGILTGLGRTAQDSAPLLVAGSRVRLSPLAAAPITGTMVGLDGTGFVLRPDSGATTMEIPLDRIARIDVWACCSTGQEFAAGALIGAGLAVVGGLLLQQRPTAGANMAMAGVVLVGLPVGVIGGGLLGMHLLSLDTWVPVPVPARRAPPG